MKPRMGIRSRSWESRMEQERGTLGRRFMGVREGRENRLDDMMESKKYMRV